MLDHLAQSFLRIGETLVEVATGDPVLGELATTTFEAFAAPPGRADLRVELTWDGGNIPAGPSRPRAAPMRVGYQLEWTGAAGTLADREARLSIPREAQSIDTALRLALIVHLLPRGGLMLHGMAARRHGAAFVGIGVSTAGKSTLCKLVREHATDADLFTDEAVPVRLEPDGVRAYGSPWWGELGPGGRPGDAPLARLALLEKSDAPQLVPVTDAHALSVLLRCAMVFQDGAEAARQALNIGAELVRRCRPVAFRFPKDERAATLFAQALRAA